MNIEYQVCSFELSKRLKELGAKQTAYWKWTSHDEGETIICWPSERVSAEEYSAFTVAELGELLPNLAYTFRTTKDNWISQSREADQNFRGTTEADARAKMLIFLIENNFINLNKENP